MLTRFAYANLVLNVSAVNLLNSWVVYHDQKFIMIMIIICDIVSSFD